MQQTLILLKPDAVQRRLVGDLAAMISGQLLAQLSVGGPQFAIADRRSASSTRNGLIAARAT